MLVFFPFKPRSLLIIRSMILGFVSPNSKIEKRTQTNTH
uniref:Uncharacterized protein n=1 Tax=Rhizophora mucronata TaxID=61149 RepID=A0A2P2NT09_RHIMU